MSADPTMMQQMLMQSLQGPQSVGGMQSQSNPMQGGAQLMQKIMLMRALQGQHPNSPPPVPSTFRPPVLPQVQPQQPIDPSLMPPPGNS